MDYAPVFCVLQFKHTNFCFIDHHQKRVAGALATVHSQCLLYCQTLYCLLMCIDRCKLCINKQTHTDQNNKEARARQMRMKILSSDEKMQQKEHLQKATIQARKNGKLSRKRQSKYEEEGGGGGEGFLQTMPRRQIKLYDKHSDEG